MMLATDGGTALGAPRLLHGHPALADRELDTVVSKML